MTPAQCVSFIGLRLGCPSQSSLIPGKSRNNAYKSSAVSQGLLSHNARGLLGRWLPLCSQSTRSSVHERHPTLGDLVGPRPSPQWSPSCEGLHILHTCTSPVDDPNFPDSRCYHGNYPEQESNHNRRLAEAHKDLLGEYNDHFAA